MVLDSTPTFDGATQSQNRPVLSGDFTVTQLVLLGLVNIFMKPVWTMLFEQRKQARQQSLKRRGSAEHGRTAER